MDLGELSHGFYRVVNETLGFPASTILGLSILGVLVGLYWILTSKEVEIIVD